MLDFAFATPEEICAELGARLRRQRLAQGLRQAELAQRAAVSPGTIKNLEGKGQSSTETLVRVVSALGLVDELAKLFELKVTSIAAMERAQQAQRQRAPRKSAKPKAART